MQEGLLFLALLLARLDSLFRLLNGSDLLSIDKIVNLRLYMAKRGLLDYHFGPSFDLD